MAFDLFDNQDEEDDKQKNQASGEVQLGPESGTQDPGDSKTQNSGTGGTSSGAFTNLQSYLDANKSLNFGSSVAGQVQKNVDTANQSQKDAATGFKQDVDQQTIATNPDLIQQVGTDATAITSDPQKTSDFLRMRNAQYGGPNNLVDEGDRYKAVSGATNTAQQDAEATKSEGGRKALLDKDYGAGVGRYDYTPGQKNLDNLLIQNDPTARKSFDTVQQNAAGAGAGFQSLKDQLQSYAGQAKATTGATRAATRSALGIDDAGNIISENGKPNSGAIGSLYGKLASNTQEKQSAYDTASAHIKNAIATKDLSGLTPEERQMLGAQLPESQGYYRANPSDYLNFAPREDINLGSTASKEDAARMDALSQLADQGTNPFLDSSKAGTAPTDYANFDQDRFSGTINSNKATFEGKQNSLNDEIKSIWNTPVPITGAGNPIEQKQAAIQAKYDELNSLRSYYGLPPVANPYTGGVSLPNQPLGTQYQGSGVRNL